MEARDATPAPELRPLGVGEMLDVSIKIYLRHFRTLLTVVALVVVPVELLLVPLLASALPDPELMRPQTGAGAPAGDPFASGELGPVLVANGIGAVFSLVGLTLAQAAAFKAIADAYLGRRPDWRSSLRLAARRLHSALWISVLIGLLFFLALIPFILPAFWLAVAWSVAIPALMVEDLRGRRALNRSFHLIRRRWWPTFAAVLLGFLLAAVLQALTGGLLQLLVITGAVDSPFAGVLLNQLGTAIGAAIATPFQAAIVAVIYFDLRVRKEGFDLELLAERVGIEPGGRREE